MIVEMCGAGGSGGCSNTSTPGGGGGGGAYLKQRMVPGTYTYGVGIQAFGVSPNTAGNAGGTTTFGTLNAGGGSGGDSPGGGGGGGGGTFFQNTGVFLMGVNGSGGGGGPTSNLISAGGSCFFGNAQPPFNAIFLQTRNAQGYGAGGIGSNSTNGFSGDGAPGRIIITEFY